MKRTLITVLAAITLSTANAQLTNLNVGDNAPNFAVTDLHGDTHQLSDFSGKYLLVDLFAHWCGPCAQLAPIVNEFYVKYGCNGYDIQVLSVEYEGTTAQTQAFENANGGDPNHPTPTVAGQDGGGSTFHSAYPVQGFPTFIIIGPDGKIKNKDIWPISNVSSFENAMTSAGATLVPNTCSSLAIDEIVLAETSIYPNPSAGELNVNYNASHDELLNAKVLNIAGQEMYFTTFSAKEGSNNFELVLSDLVAGTYFLQLMNASGKTFTHQFQLK